MFLTSLEFSASPVFEVKFAAGTANPSFRRAGGAASRLALEANRSAGDILDGGLDALYAQKGRCFFCLVELGALGVSAGSSIPCVWRSGGCAVGCRRGTSERDADGQVKGRPVRRRGRTLRVDWR